MKKFVHLQFNCNNKSEHAKNTLLIDNNQIPIHLKKGIWLTNICVDEKSSVSLKVKNENIKLITQKIKFFILINLHSIKNIRLFHINYWESLYIIHFVETYIPQKKFLLHFLVFLILIMCTIVLVH